MWNYYQPVKIIFGDGELQNIAQYLKENHMDRAFLVADSFQVQCGNTAKLEKAAEGMIVGVFSDIEPNPTIKNVADAVTASSGKNVNSIIAFGGGSAMDCAKSLAVVLAEACNPHDLLNGFVIDKALPVLAIPTTAGTGSEVTAGAVLSDKEKGIKAAIFSPAIFPKLALVDPELTYTVPSRVTAVTGLDVLAHSFDAMTSIKANDATDALALRAAKLAVAYLERAVTDGMDKEAREGMAKASTIAGLAFSQTGTTGSHACSYILTAKYHVPHGEACAFTLDSWLLENVKVKLQLNQYAKELGFENIAAVSRWLNEKKAQFGMRTRLSQIGATEADIEEIVTSSLASSNMVNNIAQIGKDGVMAIFRKKM